MCVCVSVGNKKIIITTGVGDVSNIKILRLLVVFFLSIRSRKSTTETTVSGKTGGDQNSLNLFLIFAPDQLYDEPNYIFDDCIYDVCYDSGRE
jgi:hypothetical protein